MGTLEFRKILNKAFGPRGGYSTFTVTVPISAATGTIKANPQYGTGGGTQAVIDIENFGGCLSFDCYTKFPNGKGE